MCSNEQFAHAEEATTVNDDKVMFSFISDYVEVDIIDTLKEVFANTKVTKANLVTRERTTPLSADHFCLVELEPATLLKEFSWPVMDPDDMVVFQELTRIKK